MADIITYPSYLNQPAYEYRKVTINVMRAKSLGSGFKEAFGKVKQRSKELGSLAIDAVTDPSQIVKNVEINSSTDNAVTILTMVLPLPNGLSDNQGHQWQQETGTLGTLGSQLQSITVGDVGGVVTSALGKVPVIGGALSGTANQLSVNKMMGEFSEKSGLRKPLFDPGFFQNYTGTDPRTFNFTFDLVPQSPEEAKAIITMILKLKEYSSPELAKGGVTMLAPHFFDIEFSNKYISSMVNMRGVVLKNISVDYGADGAMQQYPDGTPKYIQMALQFAERSMTHAGIYKENTYGSSKKKTTKR